MGFRDPRSKFCFWTFDIQNCGINTSKIRRKLKLCSKLVYEGFRSCLSWFFYQAFKIQNGGCKQEVIITHTQIHTHTHPYTHTHTPIHTHTHTSIQIFFKNHVFSFLTPRKTIITCFYNSKNYYHKASSRRKQKSEASWWWYTYNRILQYYKLLIQTYSTLLLS